MDLKAPLYGFRAYRLEFGKLVSGAGSVWPFGVHEARCESRRFHELEHPGEPYRKEDCSPELIPNPECECGIYGYRDFSKLYEKLEEPYLVGAVEMWGKMCVHEIGSRSRYARLKYLGYKALGPELEKAAMCYRLELVPLEELEERVRAKGCLLPTLD